MNTTESSFAAKRSRESFTIESHLKGLDILEILENTNRRRRMIYDDGDAGQNSSTFGVFDRSVDEKGIASSSNR